MGKKDKKKRGHLVVPKLKCCESRSKCRRCPTRMLKEGSLPDTLRVRRRRLVAADTPLVALSKKQVRILVLSAQAAAPSTKGKPASGKAASDKAASGKAASDKAATLGKGSKRSGRKAA